MHDLKSIKDLQSRLENLSGKYEELDALLNTILSLREKQQVIPSSVSSSAAEQLKLVQAEQDSFLRKYEAMDFGNTPASIADCKAELDDYERYIIEKSSYVEVINFVLALDSDNQEAKNALKQHKAFAAAYDCRTNSAAQCEVDLKKYILLKKAFEEQDAARRLSDIIELSPIIDFPLVVALNTNALRVGSSSVPAADPKPAAPHAADSITPAPAADPENTTAKAENLSTKEEAPGYVKYDFSVPQRPISNRPAPDEAPVPHQGIESGLTAELTKVLSRETVAASLAEDVEHTASLPNFKTLVSDDGEQSPWREVGIVNPAAVCYSVSDDRMESFHCGRPKHFSAADFQKEMSLRSPNRFIKQTAIKDACRYGAVTAGQLAELVKESPDSAAEACDALVDSGYLKAFKLKGDSFSSFEKLYVLTGNGRKVFTNSETAAVLNLASVDKAPTPPFSSHADPVLNRQLFLRSRKLMEEYMPSRQFNVGSFILEKSSFISFFPTTDDNGTYSYVSVLGNEVKSYLIFKLELQELLPSLDTITVVGMTKTHGKALADWIYDSFSTDLANRGLQYYSVEDSSYYTYPDGLPFSV